MSQSKHALLSIQEVAEQLCVSTATLYRWRSEGQDMPRAMRIGSRVRWTQESVDEWLSLQLEAS